MKLRGSTKNHMGLLGPIIKAEVGDILIIHFHNKGCMPFSIHSKDLQYHNGDSGLVNISFIVLHLVKLLLQLIS